MTGNIFHPHESYSLSNIKNFDNFRIFEPEVFAIISKDGIMKFKVEANDQNAKRFVECIENYLKTRISDIEADLV
jgi:hypothetical protein